MKVNLKKYNLKINSSILAILFIVTIFFVCFNVNALNIANNTFYNVFGISLLTENENIDSGVLLTYEETSEKFETLDLALASVPDDVETNITLYSDVEITSKIVINANKKIVIDGQNKYSFVRGKVDETTWYVGGFFQIHANGDLTLKNVVVDGKNNWGFDDESYQVAQKIYGKYTHENFIILDSSEPIATDRLFYNSGNLSLINSEIKNHYSNKGSNVIYGTAGSKTILKGAHIVHNASTDGGLISYISGAEASLYVEEGTIIEDNFAGGNGGIFKTYTGADVYMNDGIVRNNRAVNSNGVISMTYGSGSTFVMNGGVISGNSGVPGKSNGRNGMIYIHSGSAFIMNGGTITNNQGTSNGGVDAPGYSNANIELNAGTISNNESLPAYTVKSDVNIQYDYNLVLGENMVIDGNMSVSGAITNNGVINGNLTIDVSKTGETTAIDGSGQIKGDVVVQYTTETAPTIESTVNVEGEVVTASAEQVVITFHYNGGIDGDGKSQKFISVIKGEIPVVPTPTKEGYSLTWYSDSALTNEWKPSEVSSKMTIYAGWQKNSYNVTFHVDGVATTKEYLYGEIIELPDSPSKIGYTFLGWNGYTEGMTVPGKDIMFTANWKINEYIITFDSNGGSDVKTITQKYGSIIKLPKNPTRTGYNFVGWTGYSEDMVMPNKNLTFVAKWKIKTYTIKFETNGVVTIKSAKYKYGSKISKPDIGDTGCKKLVGWYTDPEFKNLYNFNKAINENITLYAKWVDNHDYGEWIYQNDTYHIRVCKNDSSHIETSEHEGGSASVDSKAICEVCHAEYGEVIIVEPEIKEYKITNGANSKYTLEENLNLIFSTNANIENFTGLEVNGKVLEKSNYFISADSSNINVKYEYLNTLEPGVYEIVLLYSDGSVSTEFVILQKNTGEYNLKTFNFINLIPIGLILVLCVLVIIIFIKKKNKK